MSSYHRGKSAHVAVETTLLAEARVSMASLHVVCEAMLRVVKYFYKKELK